MIVEETVKFVKEKLKNAEAGHDWWHILRVWKNTKLILENEKADVLVCELAALLHDIADSKFHDGNESIGPEIAASFLQSQGVEFAIIEHVRAIIQNMSYSSSLGTINFHSKELEIVQDADRLDALGAIGIARTFHYGGYKNRELYNPESPFEQNLNKEAYKNSKAPSIHHFYEKLLLLKDKMNTASAKKIAEGRHQYMEDFLLQFYTEWEGEK